LKHVLITRPEPGATQTAARLAARGFIPVVAPLLSIIPKEVRLPGHVAATLLTSGNAIAACHPSLYARPVVAVGTSTAARAAEYGFRHVVNADGDASALLNLVAANLAPADGSLFLPTGQGQGTELVASLRRLGFRVIRRIAYKVALVPTLPEPAAIQFQRGQLTVAMFFSGETSRHFVRLLRKAGLIEAVSDVHAISISERAATALRTLPWRRVSVAAKPNQESMLVLLDE